MNLFNGGYLMPDDTQEPPELEKICRVCSVERGIRRGKMLLVTGKCPLCEEYHILFKVGKPVFRGHSDMAPNRSVAEA